ncbi:ParB/RepB/Spo0J family partition protein [Streptomyces sioyaensis]|uniref:ParB/RepB/Spo0J family partition protein n=1 Tax=Streptomyces sioyaensis TaxID=67364 RepID=UPI0037D38704
MAGRRTSLASLAGQKVDDVPGKSDPLLLTLPLVKLVPTRFNPRRNFGSEEELREFGLRLKKRQLQPAVVVSRSSYLKLWPEEETNVGDAAYVIANGERRYRGSRAAGLATLNVVHNEDVANSRADFLDAVLAENNDREDLDPIERALGIETMVMELGGTDKVAAHYGKTKGWVSQQRKLLKLTTGLQELVSKGEIPVRVARDIAGLAASEQADAWKAEQKRRKEEQERRATASSVARPRKAKADRTAFSVAEQGRDQDQEVGRDAEPDSEPALRFTAVNRPPAPVPTVAADAATTIGALPAQTAESSSASAPRSSASAAPPTVKAPTPHVPTPGTPTADASVGHAVEELFDLTGDPEGLADALVQYLPQSVWKSLAEALLCHVN